MTKAKSSLRSKIGIAIIIIGFIFPVFGLIVPMLGFSAATSTALVAFFMVGGPEIFLILGAALAGKEGITLVTNRIKRLLGLPEGKYPASKTQYNIGLALILVWFIVTIASGYIPGIYDVPIIHDNIIWISMGLDVLFLIAVFGFGGHQMITKVISLLTWEKWELPPEETATGESKRLEQEAEK